MSVSPEVTETASLVNAFVEERIAVPDKNEIDVWRIGVCAALFSAAFQMLPGFVTQKDSYEQFNQDLADFIETVTTGAASWVELKLKESVGLQGKRVSLDESEVLRQSLKVCFGEALGVMDARNYDSRAARSHACFCLASQGIRDLIESGYRISPQRGHDALLNIMEASDAIGDEIKSIISQQRRS